MTKRIMVVDDSPATLASIDFMLTKAGFGTQMVLCAEDALRLLKSGVAPDALITDLNMGAMNGIDLIREARKLPALRNVPMLVLTTASQS
jgi:two-component system chemotaxis response regulator CheY